MLLGTYFVHTSILCADGSDRRRKKGVSLWDTFNKYSSVMRNQEDINTFVSCTRILYPYYSISILTGLCIIITACKQIRDDDKEKQVLTV